MALEFHDPEWIAVLSVPTGSPSQDRPILFFNEAKNSSIGLH
jgi:hypothetical protein